MKKEMDELTPAEAKKLRTQVSKKVGKSLRRIRKDKGVSQEQLAHGAGLYRTYIGHIETGTRLPNVFTLWRISQALGIDLSELLEDV